MCCCTYCKIKFNVFVIVKKPSHFVTNSLGYNYWVLYKKLLEWIIFILENYIDQLYSTVGISFFRSLKKQECSAQYPTV